MLLMLPEFFVQGPQDISQQQRSLWQVLCQEQGVNKIILISYEKPADTVKYMIDIMNKCNYACCRAKIV